MPSREGAGEDAAAKKAPAKKAPAKAAKKTVAKAPAKAAAAKTSAAKTTAAKRSAPAAGGATPAEAGNDVRVLKVHHLRPAPGARTAKTRVGRGEGSKGKTAGRGTKGTKARYQVPARFEGGQMPLHMRLPKLKGFTNRFRVEYQVVNLDRLGELFPQGGEVTVADLVRQGAVRDNAPVKVLGKGDLGVAVQVQAHAFSASAREKIEAAGGSVTTV